MSQIPDGCDKCDRPFAYLVYLAIGAIADHFDQIEDAGRVLQQKGKRVRFKNAHLTTGKGVMECRGRGRPMSYRWTQAVSTGFAGAKMVTAGQWPILVTDCGSHKHAMA